MEFSIRRLVVAGLFALVFSASATAQDVQVMDSAPKAQAVIGEPSSSFFVRFDRPIDHIQLLQCLGVGDADVVRNAQWRGGQLGSHQ